MTFYVHLVHLAVTKLFPEKKNFATALQNVCFVKDAIYYPPQRICVLHSVAKGRAKGARPPSQLKCHQ